MACPKLTLDQITLNMGSRSLCYLDQVSEQSSPRTSDQEVKVNKNYLPSVAHK